MDAHEFSNIFIHRPAGSKVPVAVQRRVDYNGTNDPVYIGFAKAGVSEAEALWYIELLEYDADGRYIKSTFSNRNVTWSGRAGHTYA